MIKAAQCEAFTWPTSGGERDEGKMPTLTAKGRDRATPVRITLAGGIVKIRLLRRSTFRKIYTEAHSLCPARGDEP